MNGRSSKIQLRKRLPLVWLFLLLAAAIAIPHQVWNTLLIGLGGLLLIAYLWATQMAHHLYGARRLRFGWVAVGDRLSEQFEVVNRSGLPALWIEIIDESNVPGYQAAVVRSIGAQNSARWRQSAICRQRGKFNLGPWCLHTADPFGIFKVTIHYPISDEIVIHPPLNVEVPISLPVGKSGDQTRSRGPSWQATINAASVRDYRPNDPLRWVHWPTSARRDELFVREFDLDTSGDIWLLLDMQAGQQLGVGIDGTEEHAVLLAAALAADALRQQRAVGLAAYGQEPQLVRPDRGQQQQWKLLHALALARADGSAGLPPAFADIVRQARQGSALIIITPNAGVDWLPELVDLARHNIHSSVILLDRASFGGRGNSAALSDIFRQQGVPSQLIHQGDISLPEDEGQRRGFWEFKVTGTGHVVTVRSPFEATNDQ